jgi:hypothetical protein
MTYINAVWMNGFSRHVHMTSPFSLRYMGQIPDTSPPGPGPKKTTAPCGCSLGCGSSAKTEERRITVGNSSSTRLVCLGRVSRMLMMLYHVVSMNYPLVMSKYLLNMGCLWDFYGIYDLVMTNIAMLYPWITTNTWSVYDWWLGDARHPRIEFQKSWIPAW